MSETKREAISKYALSKDARPKAAFSKIGIVGCGKVGRDIAILVSSRGIDVIFIELTEEKIKDSLEQISIDLDNMIDRWGMTTGEKRAVMSRIKGSVNCVELASCELVFEAVRSKSKKANIDHVEDVFKKIESHVSEDTIIATNATILGVTEISSSLQIPERSLSIHFLLSVPDAPVVEVTWGVKTSEEVKHKVDTFVKLLGKKLIPVFESPGGISARLVSPLINDACQMYLEGIGSMDDIDDMMTKGLGMRLGPFAMADKIGLDKILLWLDGMYQEFGDLKYKAHTLLKNNVRANHLGRKTLIGFYKYNEHGRRTNKPKCC